jgi:hypothetical protein
MKSNQSAVCREAEAVARLGQEKTSRCDFAPRCDQSTPVAVPTIALAGKFSAAREPAARRSQHQWPAVETVVGALIAAACYFVLSQPVPHARLSHTPAAPVAIVASGK